MKFLSSKRRVIATAIVILLLLFFLRPGASRLKSRIVLSISSAVGRNVDISSVHLRLLPRPGFDLENLVVYDDPAFGAEPMLRASEVTAALRLTSLLRGRLEIARLDLTEPSLNLVHGVNGRWNLEALLERTAHTPLAPTAKGKTEPRPGFPYIEGTSARINFKSGPEKTPYALTNADFSLWQDSENAWGLRLKAQPVRTDLNLNDTGLLRVNGTWQRAATLRETPLNFNLEWNHAQLGQISKFLTRSDQGWRGGVLLEATLTGTPAKLVVSSSATVQDFRRYDITSGEAMHLGAHCDAQYSSVDHILHEIMCTAPVGSGMISLKGDSGLPGSHRYGLVLTAQDVPAGAALALAQRAKKNLPEDLIAGGTVRGSLTIDERAASAFRFEGRGEIADLHLISALNKAEIGPELIPFVFTTGEDSVSRKQAGRKGPVMRMPAGPHLEFGPFPVGIGRGAGPTALGWVNRSGYSIAVAGEAEISKALRASRLFGLPSLNATAEGLAQLDIQIAGSWPGWSDATHAGFFGPQVTGSAKLRDVRVALRGVGGPVEISSAELQLGSDGARVEKLNAIAADTSWTGSLEMPRGCGTPGACEVHFNLSANRIALSDLSEWASPRQEERPWYRMLESTAQAGPSLLGTLRASGRVTTDNFQAHGLSANRVSAKVTLDHGKLQISELKGEILGGRHLGAWQADFAAKPAVCSGSGNLDGIVLARIAGAADETKAPWITGAASGRYDLSGPCTGEFWTAAEGTLQFDVSDGAMSHLSLAEDEGPLKIARLSGQARLRGGQIEMKAVKLDSPGGKFLMSGSASVTRELDLKLARIPNGAAPGYSITGTLTEPRVAPLPGAEQAQLKP